MRQNCMAVYNYDKTVNKTFDKLPLFCKQMSLVLILLRGDHSDCELW